MTPSELTTRVTLDTCVAVGGLAGLGWWLLGAPTGAGLRRARDCQPLFGRVDSGCRAAVRRVRGRLRHPARVRMGAPGGAGGGIHGVALRLDRARPRVGAHGALSDGSDRASPDIPPARHPR